MFELLEESKTLAFKNFNIDPFVMDVNFHVFIQQIDIWQLHPETSFTNQYMNPRVLLPSFCNTQVLFFVKCFDDAIYSQDPLI